MPAAAAGHPAPPPRHVEHAPPPPLSPPLMSQGRRHQALAAVTALFFCLMATSFNALGVVLPAMVETLHLSWSEAGFGFTLLGLACGLTSPLPAVLIRRFGIVATLILAAVTLVAGFACFARARGGSGYDAGAILIGCAFTVGGAVPGTHVATRLYDRSARPLGIYFGIGGLGSIAGPLFYLAVRHVFESWRPFWWGCAIVTGLSGVVAALSVRGLPAPPPTAPDAGEPRSGWAWGAMRRPAFWVIVAAYTGCLAINTTLHGLAVEHMTEAGVTPVHAAELMSFVAFLAAGAALAAGELGHRIGGRMLMIAATVAMAVAALAILAAPGTLALGIFTLAMGVGIGLPYVASAMILLDYFGPRRNLELYATMCLLSTTAALGPWLGGRIHDASGHFSTIFEALAALGLMLAMALGLLRAPAAGRDPI